MNVNPAKQEGYRLISMLNSDVKRELQRLFPQLERRDAAFEIGYHLFSNVNQLLLPNKTNSLVNYDEQFHAR